MINFDELRDNPDLLNTIELDMELFECGGFTKNIPTKKTVPGKDGGLEFLGYDPEGLATFKGDFGL